jgi:hypothetical protein
MDFTTKTGVRSALGAGALLALSAAALADDPPAKTTYCYTPPETIEHAGQEQVKVIWKQFDGLTGITQTISFPNQFGLAVTAITGSPDALLEVTCYDFEQDKEFTFRNSVNLESTSSRFVQWGASRKSLCDVVTEVKLLLEVTADLDGDGLLPFEERGNPARQDAGIAAEDILNGGFAVRQCVRGDTGSITIAP